MLSVRLEFKEDSNIFKKLTNVDIWHKFINQFLINLGNEIIGNVRIRAGSGIFKNSSGAYIRSVKKEIIGDTKLVVWSDVPYAMALEYGFDEERPMLWLLKGEPRRKIKLTTAEGKEIFRWITAESIGKPADNKSGKAWTYPKREGLYIFRDAFEDSKKIIYQKFHDDLIVKIIEEG